MDSIYMSRFYDLLAALLLLTALTGCGGGSTNLADGGMSGTGISSGTISGFGSIISGGIRYDTTAATVTVNGIPGMESQLDTGMIVQVNGTIDSNGITGTADSVTFNHKLIGVVDPDAANQPPETVNATGQRLIFNSYTTFVNTAGTDLVAGDPVAVSGFTDSDNAILVTHIEKLASTPATTLLEGVVSNVNTATSEFMIGGQTIDYAGAVLTGIGGGVPLNGSIVRVTGSAQTGNRLLAAGVVALDPALGVTPDDLAYVEDLVTSDPVNGLFTVGGTRIAVDGATTYSNGSVTDILVDARIQVSGNIDATSTLQATDIRFVIPTGISIEAAVTAVDIANFTLQVFGRSIQLDNFTIMIDSSAASIQSFSINDIAIGDRLILNGIINGPETLAGKIERIDPLANNSDSSLQGEVETGISDPLFSVAGELIDTSGLLDLTDFSQGPFQITRNGFFSAITPGMVVRVDGTYAGGTFTPTHAAIVNCCTWLVYTSADGALVGGGTDADFSWDGTLNSSSLSANVNATLSSVTPILGSTWITSDMRIFGPGTYTFDTGLIENQSTNFGTANLGGTLQTLTVGAGQIGAHVLFHYGPPAATVCGRSTCNTDVVFLWDINGIFQGSTGAGDDLGARDQLFNLSAADGDNDGVPGIAIVAGPFTGISSAYNLNHAPP